MADLSKPGKTNLSERMRQYAEEYPVPDDWHEKADAFDAATTGFYADPPTHTARQFLGAFARARKAWCAATGEPLV